MFRSLLLVLVYLGCCKGTIYYLDDEIPFLYSNSKKLVFSEGGPAFLISKESVVRINYRGIYSSDKAYLVGTLLDNGWVRYECNISAFSLCHSTFGDVFTAIDPKVGSEFKKCKNSKGKVYTSTPIYDISACDILEENLDVFYHDEYIYMKHDDLSWWVYWILVLASIILVRAVSLNIIYKLQNDTKSNQYVTVSLNMVILLIILLQGDSYYITENALFFYWVNIFYITGYLVFHVYHAVYKYFSHSSYFEPRIFNMASASFQGIVLRLYGSAETPYTLLIITLILTRMWEKMTQQSFMHNCTGLIDSIYVSLLLYTGYEGNIMYVFPLVMISKLIADKVHSTQSTKKNDS